MGTILLYLLRLSISNRMDSLEPISTKTRNILIKDMANFFILATTHGSVHYFVNGSDWHQQVK
jgi:DNA-binding ferritin-like protein